MWKRKQNLELRNKVGFSDTHHYDFFDGKESSIQPVTQPASLSAHLATVEWIDKNRQKERDNSKEPSVELQSYFTEAKQFVEQLTGYDLSAVTLHLTITDEQGCAMYYNYTDNAVHSNVDIDSPDIQKYSEELRTRILKSYLVHELMHATGVGNQTYITLATPNNPLFLSTSNGMALLDMRWPSVQAFVDKEATTSLKIGEFFEEAASEEAASRRREAYVPGVKENGDQSFSFGRNSHVPELPARFVDQPNGTFSHIRISHSAYPAAGIYAISDFTGVDIFQLILDSRNPDKLAEAKRAIIQAVERVQTGLYPKLRDTPYEAETFMASYELILAAIEKKKSQQIKLGSSAIDGVCQYQQYA